MAKVGQSVRRSKTCPSGAVTKALYTTAVRAPVVITNTEVRRNATEVSPQMISRC